MDYADILFTVLNTLATNTKVDSNCENALRQLDSQYKKVIESYDKTLQKYESREKIIVQLAEQTQKLLATFNDSANTYEQNDQELLHKYHYVTTYVELLVKAILGGSK